MVSYKADGTVIHPTVKDPNARQAVKAGDVPRTPPTPADLEAVHRATAATAEAKRKANGCAGSRRLCARWAAGLTPGIGPMCGRRPPAQKTVCARS